MCFQDFMLSSISCVTIVYLPCAIFNLGATFALGHMKLKVLVGRSQRGYRLLMVLVLLARRFSPFMYGRTESSLAKAEPLSQLMTARCSRRLRQRLWDDEDLTYIRDRGNATFSHRHNIAPKANTSAWVRRPCC